jgi:hypothetical protein
MITRLLVKTILEQARRYEWSLQGFGMFRLYLSKAVRLHVWDSRFAVEGVTTIHTHPWNFTSTVVAGRITDRLYAHVSVTRNATHTKQKIVCGPGGGACSEPPAPVRLELIQEVALTPEVFECPISRRSHDVDRYRVPVSSGSSYGLTAEAAHETLYDDGTVTIIEREFTADTEHAYVFVPVGTEWVSAEPHAATVMQVDEMAHKALLMINAEEYR